VGGETRQIPLLLTQRVGELLEQLAQVRLLFFLNLVQFFCLFSGKLGDKNTFCKNLLLSGRTWSVDAPEQQYGR
jgi:hypothetical protein